MSGGNGAGVAGAGFSAIAVRGTRPTPLRSRNDGLDNLSTQDCEGVAERRAKSAV
jgi:hypothetical protein